MTDETVSVSSHRWICCGEYFPREEVVYVCQITIMLFVIIFGCFNLTFRWSQQDETQRLFWISSTSACLGYILPQPTMVKPVRSPPTQIE